MSACSDPSETRLVPMTREQRDALTAAWPAIFASPVVMGMQLVAIQRLLTAWDAAPATLNISPGDWVTVKPEHDIPPMLRKDGAPTRGRVEKIDDGTVWVSVPIGDADVDEHSQAVPYLIDQLQPEHSVSVVGVHHDNGETT